MLNIGAYGLQLTRLATRPAALGANPPSANGKNDELYVIGVKGKVTAGGLLANLELAKDLGQNDSDRRPARAAPPTTKATTAAGP